MKNQSVFSLENRGPGEVVFKTTDFDIFECKKCDKMFDNTGIGYKIKFCPCCGRKVKKLKNKQRYIFD